MKLLEPLQIGPITLKNRIMFPPLSTGYEERDGSIGPRSFSFYTRLAKGGTGYIVIGDVSPVRTISPTPRLYEDAQIPSFQRLAESVHQYGAKIALQLFHPEYDCEEVTRLVLATWGIQGQMKALEAQGKAEEAKALMPQFLAQQKAAFGFLHKSMTTFVNEATHEQLSAIVEKIGAAARRAKEAGYDAIEIHGDRIVGSLCSIRLNKREDEYGGSFENRIRFALEVVEAIKKNAEGLMIEYKMPVITVDENEVPTGKGGLYIDEAIKLAKILEERGIHAIHVGQANHTGNNNDTIPSMGSRQYVFMLKYTKAIKDAVSIPVSGVGRIISSFNGEALLEQGVMDYVGYGRSLLADQDIGNKLERGEPIRECISCNKGCTDAIAGKGAWRWVSCVLNPENGFEAEREIKEATNKRTIAVVGAGIAGLEAARVAALKGHHVDLYEETFDIGGQVIIASVPPRKEEMLRAINYYKEILPTLDVTYYLGHSFTKEEAKKYKDIIVATGAEPLVPGIPGIKGPNVMKAWDVLANKQVPYGDIAIMGGGLVGAETAEYLAHKGNKVTIIEMMDKIAATESPTILPIMMEDFAKHGVQQLIRSKIVEISLEGVTVDHLDEKTGEPVSRELIKADCVINALASKKHCIDLEGVEANILYCGDVDGDRPSNVDHATKTAYDAANSLN